MPTNLCRCDLKILSGFRKQKLRSRIKEHVPLFDGQVPLSGRMSEEISDVLQAMLVERRNSWARGIHTLGQAGRPDRLDSFTVSDVLIQVRNIEFAGAGEAELPALKAASQRLTDREYSRTLLEFAGADAASSSLFTRADISRQRSGIRSRKW